MCHMSPTAQVIGLLVTLMGSAFILWHIWSFDRFKCLCPNRRDLFRWIVLMLLVVALIGFTIWNGVLCWVKYTEYYAVVPIGEHEVEIMPVPFQLWTEHRQSLVRALYHIVSLAWASFVSVHVEETLYWHFLIRSIRKRTCGTWFQSVQFKVWLVCVLAAFGVLPGVACIETTNLTMMEDNIFMAGSIFGLTYFIGSVWLLLVFPNFISESRRQGANPEVLGRLQYFKELNVVRTAFRGIYSISLFSLAVDGYTTHQFLNTTPFWLDTLFILAHFSAFASTAISVMILLPRSMIAEAGVSRTTAPVFVGLNPVGGDPFAPPRMTGRNLRTRALPADPEVATTTNGPTTSHHDEKVNPWGVLGDRLNLDKTEFQDLAEQHSSSSLEMFDVPFAARPGATRLHEGDEMAVRQTPQQLRDFRSPVDVAGTREPIDLKVVVMTDTVIEK